MSGRYVSRVLESDLPAYLSKTAEALATFADDGDGSRIRPSMDYLAWLTKQSVRTVQNHMAELKRREILVELHPATRRTPAHYRMDLAKLPTRIPFRLPEVQLVAPLEPPVEVQPTCTPPAFRGATLPDQGCNVLAPDPSVPDPYVHTHTPRAREDAPPEVQPVAPLTAALPLLGQPAPAKCAHPNSHAWCDGRVHVPRALHFEFLDRLGAVLGETRAEKAGRLVAFYAADQAQLPATTSVGNPFAYWKAAFDVWVTPAPVAHTSARPAPTFHEWNCPHTPECGNRVTCGVVSARKVG